MPAAWTAWAWAELWMEMKNAQAVLLINDSWVIRKKKSWLQAYTERRVPPWSVWAGGLQPPLLLQPGCHCSWYVLRVWAVQRQGPSSTGLGEAYLAKWSVRMGEGRRDNDWSLEPVPLQFGGDSPWPLVKQTSLHPYQHSWNFISWKRLPLECSPLGSGTQNQLACGKGQNQNQMDLELLVNVPSKGTLTDMFHGCTVLGRPRGLSEVVQLFTLSRIFLWLHPVPHVLLLGAAQQVHHQFLSRESQFSLLSLGTLLTTSLWLRTPPTGSVRIL